MVNNLLFPMKTKGYTDLLMGNHKQTLHPFYYHTVLGLECHSPLLAHSTCLSTHHYIQEIMMMNDTAVARIYMYLYTRAFIVLLFLKQIK